MKPEPCGKSKKPMIYISEKPAQILYRSGENHLAIGTIGRVSNTIDYALPSESIRHAEKELVYHVTGVAFERIVMLNQVHGDEIIELAAYPAKDLPWIADADGMITALPALCLVIRTADCVPVFTFDEKKKLLGAAHSGWKGCQLDITGKLIRMMKAKGSTPSDVSLFILPSIGPDSYRVNDDVARLFPEETVRKNGTPFVNLRKSVMRSALREGIRTERIFHANICTLQNESYFSHRRGDAGRNLNFGIIHPQRENPQSLHTEHPDSNSSGP